MEGRRGENGAGGKLAKRPFRPRPTPYARPAREDSRQQQQQQQQHQRQGTDRWFSKFLVQPVVRILPSLFSSSARDQGPPSLESPPKNEQEDCDGDSTLISENQFPESKDPGASAETGQPKVGCKGDELAGDRQGDAYNSYGLAEIEQRLKHKMFTRDETNRLIELLRSRTTDLPIESGDAARSIVETVQVTLDQKDSKTLAKEDAVDRRMTLKSSQPLQLTAHDVSSSPVDIAKAYMEARKSASDYDCQSARPKNEKSPVNDDSSQLCLSSAVKSPICWPGSVVHGDHGYLTPQTQSGRIGPRNFTRTPYSGALFSRSTSKFQGVGERSNLPSAGWKQSYTPVFGGNTSKRSSVLDDDLASVNPIRHVRQKNLATTTPKGAGPSNRASPFSLLSNSPVDSMGISSTFQGNLEQGSSKGRYRNLRSIDEDEEASRFNVGSSTVHPQSFKMAQKILEHLDRPVFPKEKSQELELAIGRSKVSSKSAVMNDQDKTPGVSQDSKTGYLFGRDMGAQESEYAKKVFLGPSTSKSQDKDQLSSLPPQTGKQGPVGLDRRTGDSEFFQMPKSQAHSFTKASEKMRSSGNGFGFSFPAPPAANLFSEPPPTPTMNTSLASGRMLPTSEETIPSFNFGPSRADNNRLVFALDSVANSTITDTAAPKFTFGSDEKRLSFKSVAKDAICY